MRGEDRQQAGIFSYVSPEQRVPADHPLRTLRPMVDEARHGLSSLVEGMYAEHGRPSIPEKLLRALVLQLLYSVRSERLLMEQLDYNLLFRWFVGLNVDEPVWDASTFSKNRQRLLDQADRAILLCRGGGAGPHAGAALGRTLHGGRDAHRGMGLAPERPAEG